MVPGPRLVLKVVVVAAVLLFARLTLQPQNQPIASASPTPENTSPFNLKVQTNLVVVRVVVRDGKGEPVEGLKKHDFQLFDRRRKQTIAQFEGPTSTAENAGSDTQRSPTQTNVAPAGKPAAQHFLALYFDDLDMTAGDVADARTATDRFLKANFQPSLRIALFNTSGLLSDLTDDPNQIHDALFRLQAHRHNLGHTDCLELSDYQAEQNHQA
jgi:VWFA-related protein